MIDGHSAIQQLTYKPERWVCTIHSSSSLPFASHAPSSPQRMNRNTHELLLHFLLNRTLIPMGRLRRRYKPPTCPHKRAAQDKPPRRVPPLPTPSFTSKLDQCPRPSLFTSYYRIHSRSLPFLPTPLSKPSVSRSPFWSTIPVPHFPVRDHKTTSEISIFFPRSLHGYNLHIKLPEDQSASTHYPFPQVPAQRSNARYGHGLLHEHLALVCCLKRREQLESESPSPGLIWLRVMPRSVTRVRRAYYGALTAMRTVDEFSSQGLLVNECMMRGKKRHEGTDG
jgi:hypothetical protein